MSYAGSYFCTRCKKVTDRDELLAKNVRFMKIGRGGPIVKSRTSEWLCERCVERDNVWRLPQYYSPGTGYGAVVEVPRRPNPRPLNELERFQLAELQERMNAELESAVQYEQEHAE